MKDKVLNDWVRVASWSILCGLIVVVGWYFRSTREGLGQQAVAQAHQQYLTGLNLLIADVQTYAKTNASIIPLLNSLAASNAPAGNTANPR